MLKSRTASAGSRGASILAALADTLSGGRHAVLHVEHANTLAPVPEFLLPVKQQQTSPVSSVGMRKIGDGWLRGLVRTVVRASEGERNQTLFWAACRAGKAVREGKAANEFVTDVLVEAAAHAGLSRPEAVRTIDSGLRTGGGG
jgi:hypothetical protein